MPRGVLVFPFLMATGLTFVVLIALGQPIQVTGVLVALMVGSVAAVSSLAWHLAKSPRPAASAALASNPQATGSSVEGSDPLAHIHAVETQGRRHRKPCPNCGTEVGIERDRCPNCDHVVLVKCKGCRTNVRLEWTNCPECGRGLP